MFLLKSLILLNQDIASKVIAFSQQGPRAICVLSASGSVSTATLLQPSTSPGAIQYEVKFEEKKNKHFLVITVFLKHTFFFFLV